MQSIALVIHVLLAIGVIGLVLIQHGKGADAGAAFGSGASATVFGSRGSASFLTRATTMLAGAFFLTSLMLFYLAANRDGNVRSVTDGVSVVDDVAPVAVPAAEGDLPGGVEADIEAPVVVDDAPAAEVEPVEGASAADAPAADDLPPPAD